MKLAGDPKCENASIGNDRACARTGAAAVARLIGRIVFPLPQTFPRFRIQTFHYFPPVAPMKNHELHSNDCRTPKSSTFFDFPNHARSVLRQVVKKMRLRR